MSTRDIRRVIRRLLNEGYAIDNRTGEYNTTLLAEAAADELGHNEWLDDETHEVWDIAMEETQRVEKAQEREVTHGRRELWRERGLGDNEVSYENRDRVIREAIATFPEEFGMRKFPGKRFYINRGQSYWDDGMYQGKPDHAPGPILYVYVREGDADLAFAKGTPDELRSEVVKLTTDLGDTNMGWREAAFALMKAGKVENAIGTSYNPRTDHVTLPNGRSYKVDQEGAATYEALRRQGYDEQGIQTAVARVQGGGELGDNDEDEDYTYDDAVADEGPPDEERIRESAVIGMRGPLYSQYGASFEGKHLGTFSSMDEALRRIKVEMKRQNYYPDLFFINDHGNVSLLDAEGNEVRSWV